MLVVRVSPDYFAKGEGAHRAGGVFVERDVVVFAGDGSIARQLYLRFLHVYPVSGHFQRD